MFACALLGGGAASASVSSLSAQLARERAHTRALSGQVAGLATLISGLENQVAIVRSREESVRAELARDRQALVRTGVARAVQARRAARLHRRLVRAQRLLAAQVVSGYENEPPDLMDVILEAHGFQDLLEQVSFLRSAEHAQGTLIVLTRRARTASMSAEHHLAAIESSDRRLAQAAAVQVRALTGMDALLTVKQASLGRAQALEREALVASVSRANSLRGQIAKLRAQQAAAARAAAAAAAAAAARSASPAVTGSALAPTAGWAIPYQVVLCESGGQNLPPNSAGASGYYQILASTWTGAGGRGPAAYLAPKSEQDAVAARLWNGGAGASNWVCAGLVGIS